MKQSKRYTALLLAALLIVFSFSGCGKKTGKEATSGNFSGVKILMVMPQIDTFRQAVVEAATAEAEQKGMQLEVVSTTSSDEQVEFMKKGASEGYDIIICNPVDADTTLQLEIAAGDLPIVFTNSCPKESLLEKGKYVYAGSNEEEAGIYQAEYVLDKLGSQNEINVAFIEGSKGHSATLGRTNAAKKVLAESGKKINYVFDDFGNWDQATAKEMFEIFLKTGNTADCVLCNNDAMAIGVIEACAENNIDPKSIMILGVDATADGCEEISDGCMSYTVCQSASGQGKACIDAVSALLSGAELSEVEYATEDGLYVNVPFEPVTKENVKNYQ